MNVQLVFAYCKTKKVNGEEVNAFGLDDALPWGHNKQDMINFAKRTKDTMVVMGAKTFISLPSLLKDRPHMVIIKKNSKLPTTKDGKYAEYYIFEDEFENFLESGKCGGLAAWYGYEYKNNIEFHKNYENISIIGGISIIVKSLPFADKVVMSRINKRHYVYHNVTLPQSVIDFVESNVFHEVEKHWWILDELTELTEIVYEE